MFYDPDAFSREGAVPGVIRDVLFGKGGVQGLDDEVHVRRKSMFLKIMGPEAGLDDVVTLFEATCRETASTWHGRVDVFTEMTHVLTRTIYAWADVPLAPEKVVGTARDLANLFLHAGPDPVGQVRARMSRHRLQAEMAHLIEMVRKGEIRTKPDAALALIAQWRDGEGHLLPVDVAAVELINVLRPTVAIAVYLVFVADALVLYADDRVRTRDDAPWRNAFVQEVRRLYPFFPATAAIARRDIVWRDEKIASGTRVLIDIYGTNREAARWKEPDTFSPTRFLDWPGDAYSLIPQGGGAHAITHRCPGEWLTIRLMESFVLFMSRDLDWRREGSRNELDCTALPALPKGGFFISDTNLN